MKREAPHQEPTIWSRPSLRRRLILYCTDPNMPPRRRLILYFIGYILPAFTFLAYATPIAGLVQIRVTLWDIPALTRIEERKARSERTPDPDP